MEVRGNDQHRAALSELSRRLGGYAIVIDPEIPDDEIHVIQKTNGSQPAKKIINIGSLFDHEFDECA